MDSTETNQLLGRPLSSRQHDAPDSQPDVHDSQSDAELHQPGSTDGRPDQHESTSTPPNQPDYDLGRTLIDINSSINGMATILTSLVEGDTSRRSRKDKRKHWSDSGHSEAESENSDHRSKRTRSDDTLSVGASDHDIRELLDGGNNAENNTDNTAQDNTELDFLTAINNSLNEEEKTGPTIVQKLADIALKRWGTSLTTDKLKTILAKHETPENCGELSVPKVNPEIWSSLSNFKKSADLRLGNIQQAVQKATIGMLKACDSLLTTTTGTDNNTAIAHSIDAIALMGHAVGALSRIRREQIKPALKPAFYSLCNKTNEAAASTTWLFGDDLAKQVRDAKETNTISQSLGATRNKRSTSQNYRSSSTYRPDNRPHNSRQFSQRDDQTAYQTNNIKPHFLGKGQKKPNFKNKNRKF